jgi:hypothetical protein
VGLPGIFEAGRGLSADKERRGLFLTAGGDLNLGFHMTVIARALALGRSLFADDFGGSQIRLAILIGLSASAVLVLVRVGTAVAAAAH